MKPLLIATTNEGKRKELSDLLEQHFPSVFKELTLKDFPNTPEVPEDGQSFLENALFKAKEYYRLTEIPVIADDTGLVIPSLKGEPGVYSARYAGENKDFQANIDLVLKKMEGVKKRDCFFTTCMVFLAQQNLYTIAEGFLSGEIAQERQGNFGFGYDSIVILPSLNLHVAELSLKEKQSLSHRGNAFSLLLPSLSLYAQDKKTSF